MIYDLIIVGAGPAGMTAAIYAARRKINFIIISLDVGGQMSWSSDVENYPGTTSISGVELANNFRKHLEVYGIKIKQEETVNISKKKDLCVVKTKRNTYESKAVLIASGKAPKKLGVPGEEELLGKGVNYCAVCDAPLYGDKTVAVVGGGNSGMDAAIFLSKYAKKVYIFETRSELTGESYLKEKITNDKKIEVITGVAINEIKGKNFVSSLVYEKAGKTIEIKLDGIFVEIGLITKADFTNVQKNRWGDIMIFRSTRSNEENMTSVSGIYAAGDVTDVTSKQIVVAAGEGCKAFLAASDYISRWDGKHKENKK
ncbi:MAG: FAD-dependent oxidoreductase [Nanoarchaeota archaeon]